MAFEQKTWVNVPEGETPPEGAPAMGAENLNRIEQGIADAHQLIEYNNTDINERVDTEVENISKSYLPLSGGKLTGNVILNNSPSSNYHLVNKQYVDNNIHICTFAGTVTNDVETCIGTLPNYNATKQTVFYYCPQWVTITGASFRDVRVGSWVIIGDESVALLDDNHSTASQDISIRITSSGSIWYKHYHAKSDSYPTLDFSFSLVVVPCKKTSYTYTIA